VRGGFGVRLVSGAFVVLLFLAMGLVVACSELPPPEPPPPGPTVTCRNTSTDDISFLNWELIVRPDPIESGEPFTAILGGNAVFNESFLDTAQTVIPGGVEEVNLVGLKATVHVRSGATGDDVVLTVDPALYDGYQCSFDKSPCDLANDVLDDPPRAPGLRGNTDCDEPAVSPANPCGRFVSLPTSRDCFPEGICDGLGKAGPDSQCELNGFCVTGDLPLRLQEDTGQYTAATNKTEVLFGWDDESTGATIEEEGRNEGTWILPEADYYAATGPNGFRITVAGFPVALECTMGVDSQGPHGVDSFDPLSSPTPNSELITFPIQTEGF